MKYLNHILKLIGCLLLFNVTLKNVAGQIVDTIEFEYEEYSYNAYSTKAGTLRLNTNLYSYPIIECCYNGDTVCALIQLSVILERMDSLSRNMKIKSVGIFFVGLEDSLKGPLNSYCPFYSGNPPENISTEQQKDFIYLQSKIAEITMSWDWAVINSDFPFPKEIHLYIPFYCVLIWEQNWKELFVPLK